MKNFLTEPLHFNRLSWLRLIGWVMVLLLTVMSLISLPQTNITIKNSDKWLHLITYFTVTYWFFHIHIKKSIHTVIGFIFLGVALEMLQSLTPHRYFEWLDMLMNVTGVFIAFIVFWLFKFRINYILRPLHN